MTSLLIDSDDNDSQLLQQFQQVVKDTHIHKFNEYDMLYFSNGLGGECGEVQNEVKKLYRALSFNPNLREEIELRKKNIKSELGDVLWYLTAIANNLNCNLEEIIHSSISKCQKHVCTSTYTGQPKDELGLKQSIRKKDAKLSPEEQLAIRNLVKIDRDYWNNN